MTNEDKILNECNDEFSRLFPSSLVLLFQNECETILMKMTLICIKMKLHAELVLVLKQMHKRSRKWFIVCSRRSQRIS